MELKGRVKFLGELAEGTSANGNGWQRQDFVIDYVSGKNSEGEKIVKQGVFQGFGKVVDFIKNLKEGDLVEVFFNMEAREYNGKWYGTNSVWKIDKLDSKGEKVEPKKEEVKKESPKVANDEGDGDLPF